MAKVDNLWIAITQEREGVKTWNLAVLLVFICYMNSINFKRIWDGGLKKCHLPDELQWNDPFGYLSDCWQALS